MRRCCRDGCYLKPACAPALARVLGFFDGNIPRAHLEGRASVSPVTARNSERVAEVARLADRLASEVMVEYLVPPGSVNESEVKGGARILRVRALRTSR